MVGSQELRNHPAPFGTGQLRLWALRAPILTSQAPGEDLLHLVTVFSLTKPSGVGGLGAVE